VDNLDSHVKPKETINNSVFIVKGSGSC